MKCNCIRTFVSLSTVTCSFLLLGAQHQAGEVRKVTIDLDTQYQTIVDFGASDCWLSDFLGKCFDDAVKEKVSRWLFSQELDSLGNPMGIGLSNWRVNLGAGSSRLDTIAGIVDEKRRADCFLEPDGRTYDWTRCSGQQYFMQKAKEYGVEHMLFFSNSPLIYYTKNGYACNKYLEPGANLKEDCYDDYAEYIAETIKHFTEEGYPIAYISPVNEPQYEWGGGQEGSPWFNDEIAHLVREIDKSLENRGLNTQILIPEAGDWTQFVNYTSMGRAANQLLSFFDSTYTSTFVGNLKHTASAIAGHDYWTYSDNNGLTTLRQQVGDKAIQYGLQVFASEFSLLDFPQNFPIESKMDASLFLAKVIQCDMIYANCVSWNYWTAFAQEQWGQGNRFHLLRVNAAGDNGAESYGDIKNGGDVFDDTNLWALGNFSRFIRPNYKRVELTGASDVNNFLGSAYVSPDSTTVVAVMVNFSKAARNFRFVLEGMSKEISKIYSYTTNARLRRLRRDGSLSEQYDGAALSVPARSIVTYIMKLDDKSLAGDIKSIPIPHDKVFNLTGQLVREEAETLQGLPSGFYIWNGRKYFVK